MPIWKAIILGLIQGLAEFLPISSSGHLVIFREILKVDLESGGMFFDVMLHLGTLVAIFVAFWHDISRMFVEGIHIIRDAAVNVGIWFQRRAGREAKYRHVIRSSYRKFVMLVIVSTIPTGILGVFFRSTVELAAGILIIPGICLLITAAFLVIADYVDVGEKHPKDASYVDAGLVGMAQGLATMPGLSRSGTTITACLLCGFDKRFAVKYSFIMSIPAVLGAVVLELKDLGVHPVATGQIPAIAAATFVAAVAGYLSICFMMRLIRGKSYRGFAIYCFLAGAITVGYGVLA